MILYRGAPWRFAPAPLGATRLYLASEGDADAVPAEDSEDDSEAEGAGESEGAGTTGDYAVALGAATVPAATTAKWPPGVVVAQWLRADGGIVDGGRHDVRRSVSTDGASASRATFAERMVAKYEAAVEQAASATTDLTAADLEIQFAEHRRLARELARWRKAVARQRGIL